MEFLLLGLLGAAVVWSLVDSGSGSDDETPEPVDPDIGQEVFAQSNALTLAGGGDDTIVAGEDGDSIVENATIRGGAGDDSFSLAVSDTEILGGRGDDTITGYAAGSLINGGHGDDTIDIIADTGTTVNGGLGDDTITADGERSWIYGGDGEDVIDVRGIINSDVYGGADDDLLIARSNIHDEGNVRLYGGTGDDTLRVYADHEPMNATNVLHGGVGNDVFEVVFNPSDSVPTDWFDRPETYHQLVRIEDFQPGRDQLHLEIGERTLGAAPTVALHATSLGTSVNITYTATQDIGTDQEEPVEMTSEIWLPGAQGVTMDDIRIVPPAAAAAA